MMCSSWKISVFGILALMLAFGMTTDALAQSVVVTSNAADLRATDVVTIAFTIDPTAHANTDDQKASTVRISIPAGWSRPFNVNEDTETDGISEADLNENGEVYFPDTTPADGEISGRIVGRQLVFTVGKSAATSTVVAHYRALVPHLQHTYGFALTVDSGGQHAIVHSTSTPTPNTQVNVRGGTPYLDIAVGPVRSGAGTVTLARSSGGPFLQPAPGDADLPHEGMYLLVSKESLSNLVITFTAAGTMPQNSTITLTLGGAAVADGWAFTRDDDSQSSVSGNVDLNRQPGSPLTTGKSLLATVKAGGLQQGARIVFTLKGFVAPTVEGTTAAQDDNYDIEVLSAIDVDGDGTGTAETAATVGNKTDGANTYTDGDPQFDFLTTKAPPSGKVTLTRATVTAPSPYTYVVAGADAADGAENLLFTFTEIVGFSGGAQFEIEIPAGLPDPYVAIGTPSADGAVSVGGTFDIKSDARKLTGGFGATPIAADPAATVTYRLDKAPAEGEYTFNARLSPGPHQPLTAVAGSTIQVVGAHGGGTMTLTKNGQPFTETPKNVEVGDLTFTYTPGGRMAVGSKVEVTLAPGWSAGRTDNGDGVADAGEVTLAGDKATLVVASTSFTATTTSLLTPADRLVFTYKSVKVPDVGPRSDTFTTKSQSHPDLDAATSLLADLAASPHVGIGRSPDGTGSIAANVTQADAGSSIGDLVFTFTAAGTMSVGSVVEITIPDSGGWPAPNTDVSQPGGVTLGDTISATLATTATTMSATIASELSKDGTIVFTYKNITAPTAGGQYTFTGKSSSSAIGTPTALQAGVTIDVDEVAAGSIALASATGPLTSADPGMALGNLAFTFTAGAAMSTGAQVQVTVPVGWTSPFLDNDDGVDAAGEVDIAGSADLSVSGGGAQPWVLTATTTAPLDIGNTLTIAYKMVTAPSAEATYTFTTEASVATGGTLLPLSTQPTVVVRSPVTGLAIEADDEFFADDSLAVTVSLKGADDAAANALGDTVVMLSSDSETGSFSDAEGNAITSVTIADNTSEASATYMDSKAGTPTLTATAGMMTASKMVTVKSGIRNLVVTPSPITAGSELAVSATGKKGGGTVMIEDAEGMQVGETKALDPVANPDLDPEGPDQSYSRTVTLPADTMDGMYKVTVTIAGLSDFMEIRVLNDQDPPTLSEASAWPTVVANGDQVALRVAVTLNESMIDIAEENGVTADVSALDSTRTDPIALSAQPDEVGVYTRLFTISADNTNADGVVKVSFTATDEVGNTSEAATAEITLKNDDIPPVLSMASAMPSPANDGMMVTISVSSESGLTVTADASSIGGGMVTLDEGTMAADANGNGANGNGANGNGANGNGANGNGANGNGMTNGNGGMGAGAMPAGNGMYSGTTTVTGAADGEQTITITATDGSGNSSEAMVTVTIDNTGPALTMASADPDMATNGTMITISVSTESGATVMADASAIGGDAATALAEGMDENMMGTGMYSADVAVADDAMDGDHMISITATDALGNAGDAASVTVTVDNTAPALADAAITPDWAENGDSVTISVSTESGATVTADASAIGGAAELALAEGMDADMMGTGMYSADVTVTGAEGGDQMVSITASDALGNMSDAATASVSIHAVTSVSFSPADVSTGDTVMVSAMGTAGLTATFDVFDAEGNNIVTDGSLTEDATTAGSYSGSFEVVIDAHPMGTYWVSATIGQASMTAEGALTIDHLAQFTLSIAAGTHLIHVPLDVTHIDGVAATIDTVGDLFDALGDSVNFIISLGADGSWNSYLGDASAGGAADAAIGDDTGLIAVMSSAASLTLAGNALGTGGTANITLGAGNNLVGVPLAGDPKLPMISSALALPGISAIVVSNAAGNGFNTIGQPGDPGDGPIMGGVGYIVVSAAAGMVPIVGMAWDNSMADMGDGMTASNGNGNGAATAPSIGFQTPVLQVQGKLIDEAGMVLGDGLNVSVKNVTRGTTLGSTTAADDYSMTFVKLDSSAAKVGDVLEIRADSSNPLIGVRPVQHVVTAADVLDSRIDLPDLVTYEIPAQTELLANYPNPFNPETWIPFRLAEDSNVSVSIYGASGSLVRTIDIGFTPAAVYEGRSDAIYWDGRNDFGEQVSSGIYFYHLSAGEFSGTRKMVIVK